MATRHVLAELATVAQAAGHDAIDIESVGGVDAEQRVAGGEAFDLVFLAQGALRRLADGGHVEAASVAPLLLSQTAVAVPDASVTAAVHDGGAAFADASALQAVLREAGRIGYSTGPSGVALVKQIEAWGLAEELGDRLVQAKPGIPVARSLAEGDVDLGFQQLSELVGQPGIRILGVLPDDCVIDTVFAGAVATAASDSAAAQAALDFFASTEAAQIKRDHAFGVPHS